MFKGRSSKYKNFYSATRYGDVDGLGGVNCRHLAYPYFLGDKRASELTPEQQKESDELYKFQQKQRYNERQIRRYKRRSQLKYESDIDNSYDLSKVKEWQKIQNELVKNNGLSRDYAREKVGIYTGKKTFKDDIIYLVNKEDLSKYDITKLHRQDGHIKGTNEYKQKLKKSKYDVSYVTLSEEEILALVKKTSQTGVNRYTKKGEWRHQESIATYDKPIGYVVNNRTGKTVKTSNFKIHYSSKGVHIVPEYPSKSKKEKKL